METIKGISNFGEWECPIEDISHLTLQHITGKNGLQIHAHIKKELVDFYSLYHQERDQYGMVKRKYKMSQRILHIRIKDDKVLHKELRKKLMAQETKQVTHGLNAGTAAAISWTIYYKEIPVEMMK